MNEFYSKDVKGYDRLSRVEKSKQDKNRHRSPKLYYLPDELDARTDMSMVVLYFLNTEISDMPLAQDYSARPEEIGNYIMTSLTYQKIYINGGPYPYVYVMHTMVDWFRDHYFPKNNTQGLA